MSKSPKIKLSIRQRTIVYLIKKNGNYPVANSQNPTVQKLIRIGICEWDSGYDSLVLTQLGKDISLD